MSDPNAHETDYGEQCPPESECSVCYPGALPLDHVDLIDTFDDAERNFEEEEYWEKEDWDQYLGSTGG